MNGETFEQRYRPKAANGQPQALPISPAPQPSSMEVLQAAAATADEYKPYHTMPHPELELWIRPNDLNQWADVYLPYTYRNHMISDGNGFYISMHYSTPVTSVVIHGRNLQELVHKLFKREIEWVQEYDPSRWPEVPDGLPCITAIEISHAPIRGKDDDGVEPVTKGEPQINIAP